MVTASRGQTAVNPEPVETDAWKLYLSGFLGGLILAIGDLATNDTSATVLKFQAVLQKYLLPNFANGGVLGLFIVGFLGAVFCWVWPAHTRGDAFVRGFSVFAIVTVGTPYKDSRDQIPFQKPGSPALANAQTSWLPLSQALASERHEEWQGNSPAADAPTGVMTINHSGISSCKPHYWGILGLGSAINNSVEICETGHVIKRGTKVKILDCWDTGLRSYRYVQLEYFWDGQYLRGWAIAGQAPTYWQYIVPESDAYAHLPAPCRSTTDPQPGKG